MKSTILKKIIPYTFYILLFALCAGFIYSGIADEFKYIGLTRLRDDVDSGYLRVNKKIAREYGVQLFNYNTSHFTWRADATGSNFGLNLLNPITDSMNFEAITINKDTTIGETQEFKSWSVSRQYYNQFSPTDLDVNYYTNGTFVARYSMLNQGFTALIIEEEVLLNTANTMINSFTLPKGGTWKITCYYDYEFEYERNMLGSDVIDSIYLALKVSPNLYFSYSRHKQIYPNGAFTGSENTASLSGFVTVGESSPKVISLYGMCSADAIKGGEVPLMRKLKRYKIFAELIN